MNSKEVAPHPTGNFPSVEEESLLRFGYIDKTNPVLKKIRSKLKELGFKGKRNLPLNILAFYYGIYFYNQVNRHAIFPEADDPPVKIIKGPKKAPATYTSEAGQIYFNIGSYQANDDFCYRLLEEIDLSEYLDITMPAYVAQIITGIEEANHLHLDKIHKKHKPNSNSRHNHRFPEQLWKNSALNPIAYRAKTWHEFAALVVQRAYLHYYMSTEHPETVKEFNDFYNEVKKERQKWVRQKKK